jgi:hypothetical protein
MLAPHHDLKAEVRAAIGAHGVWKQRLRTAIATHDTDLPVEDICRDDRCRFGQWLSTLSAAERQMPELHEVARLHTAFHQAAGSVARLAVAGKRAEAKAALVEGPFADTEATLADALGKLMRSV